MYVCKGLTLSINAYFKKSEPIVINDGSEDVVWRAVHNDMSLVLGVPKYFVNTLTTSQQQGYY